MRVSFVGKGGSGKSTLAAAFSSHLNQNADESILAFDADINIHVPEILGFEKISSAKHISHPEVSEKIQRWLIGDNNIDNLAEFRKTTPPTRDSNIINPSQISQTPLGKLRKHRGNLSVFAVGTYEKDGIGASCYHNNLSVLESVLNHTNDRDDFIVVDMVAGVDSFAGTLHAQFDMSCFVLEPTRQSLEVYKKYLQLAEEAEVEETVYVVGNKVRDQKDIDFIENNVSKDNIIGYFRQDDHIRTIDQEQSPLDINQLDKANQELLSTLEQRLRSLPDRRQQRLEKIWDLHTNYIAQGFVKERFGDLSDQIDEQFSYK